ncbi:hypothetical protein RJP21_18775 [Paenibacillus sp. VCA1]|uniref:hypothetical protein n=1 Tax=Paenibacillus sp. VCA1 TaxID=3039148 RepID=UPI0028720EC9|nr:hypothetical protein [Paenibacillus sp. VCA1]MDR9855661.1 hypothetical protein [Paenibacillus sp. VCA1]
MTQYTVSGKTVFSGKQIKEIVDAKSEKDALRIVNDMHGKLQKGCEIYKESLWEPGLEYPVGSLETKIPEILTDDEVMRIAELIQDGDASSDDYKLFSSYFRPMVSAAIRDFWNNISDDPSSDKQNELFAKIATEFIPRYDPNRGSLRPFIKQNVANFLRKGWSRKTYVNGDKTRPREEMRREFIRSTHTYIESRSRDEKKEFVISTGLRIITEGISLDRKAKKEFYGLIVELGLHNAFLTKEKQIDAIEACYGLEAKNEWEVAKDRGVTQQTIHINKRRGEDNILKYIHKNFSGSEKTSVF